MRILNENPGSSIVDTRNGQFFDNRTLFHDTANEFSRAVNIGSETLPATFEFARNGWYNQTDPANFTPNLPTPETDGIYGIDPAIDPDEAIAWSFDWGLWIVNASSQSSSISISNHDSYRLAEAGENVQLHSTSAEPFEGDWTYTELADGQITLQPFSQVLVASCDLPGLCRSADFNGDGQVGGADLAIWRNHFGMAAGADRSIGDADGDEAVDGDDFLLWQRQVSSLAALASLQNAVPEPGCWSLLFFGVLLCLGNPRG
jgi:hypothetical protein